jgi:dolichol-phosphate mannosyltransferase
LSRLRQGLGLDLELLAMDDEGHREKLERAATTSVPWLRRVVRKADGGLGSAIVEGLALARNDVVVVMNADLSHPPEAIPEMLDALLAGSEFVIGSRYVAGGSSDDRGAFRWIRRRVAKLLARPFTRIADPMSGFFAFRRSLLDRAGALNLVGYKIGLELLVKCNVATATEIPIRFAPRRHRARRLPLADQLKYIQHLRRLFIYRHPGWSYILQFAVVGGCGAIVNLAVLTALLHVGASIRVAVAAAIGVSMVANFALNRRFTFSYARHRSVLAQFTGFVAACSFGAAVNYLLTTWMLTAWPSLAPQAAAVVGILAGTGVNYTANRYLVFAKSGRPR